MKQLKVVCNLNKILESRQISQKQLSEDTGITRDSIRALQRNSSDLIHKPTIAKICAYLDVQLWELLELKEE